MTHLTGQFMQYRMDTQFVEMSPGAVLNLFSIFRESKLRYPYKLYS